MKGVPGQSFVAKAGGAVMKSVFSESNEVYVLTDTHAGRIGKMMSVVADKTAQNAAAPAKAAPVETGQRDRPVRMRIKAAE